MCAACAAGVGARDFHGVDRDRHFGQVEGARGVLVDACDMAVKVLGCPPARVTRRSSVAAAAAAAAVTIAGGGRVEGGDGCAASSVRRRFEVPLQGQGLERGVFLRILGGHEHGEGLVPECTGGGASGHHTSSGGGGGGGSELLLQSGHASELRSVCAA
jgi:hypothetical protein